MSAFFRNRIECTIEHMIGLLDEMDGDSDDEPEPVEEQNDLEDEQTAPLWFVLARKARHPTS